LKSNAKRLLRQDEIEQLIANIPKRYKGDNLLTSYRWGSKEDMIERDRALVAFLYLYGCRVSEICRGHARNYRTIRKKDGSKELKPLPDYKPIQINDVWITNNMLCARITPLKRRDREYHTLRIATDRLYMNYLLPYVEKMKRTAKPSDSLFPITSTTAFLIVSQALEAAHPRHLRHLRLNRLADQGGTLKVLKDWAGWKTSQPADEYLSRSGRGLDEWGKRIE